MQLLQAAIIVHEQRLAAVSGCQAIIGLSMCCLGHSLRYHRPVTWFAVCRRQSLASMSKGRLCRADANGCLILRGNQNRALLTHHLVCCCLPQAVAGIYKRRLAAGSGGHPGRQQQQQQQSCRGSGSRGGRPGCKHARKPCHAKVRVWGIHN